MDQERLPEAELTVSQKPVSVEFECPCCGHEIEMPYGDFEGKYGDPPDWSGSVIECPDCGKRILVDSVDWD